MQVTWNLPKRVEYIVEHSLLGIQFMLTENYRGPCWGTYRCLGLFKCNWALALLPTTKNKTKFLVTYINRINGTTKTKETRANG